MMDIFLLDKSKTVTSQWYTETCLSELFENLVSCSPLDSQLLQYANAYRAAAMQEFLEETEVKLLTQPEYNTDLAPCDFGLFPYIKLSMKGRQIRI